MSNSWAYQMGKTAAKKKLWKPDDEYKKKPAADGFKKKPYGYAYPPVKPRVSTPQPPQSAFSPYAYPAQPEPQPIAAPARSRTAAGPPSVSQGQYFTALQAAMDNPQLFASIQQTERERSGVEHPGGRYASPRMFEDYVHTIPGFSQWNTRRERAMPKYAFLKRALIGLPVARGTSAASAGINPSGWGGIRGGSTFRPGTGANVQQLLAPGTRIRRSRWNNYGGFSTKGEDADDPTKTALDWISKTENYFKDGRMTSPDLGGRKSKLKTDPTFGMSVPTNPAVRQILINKGYLRRQGSKYVPVMQGWLDDVGKQTPPA